MFFAKRTLYVLSVAVLLVTNISPATAVHEADAPPLTDSRVDLNQTWEAVASNSGESWLFQSAQSLESVARFDVQPMLAPGTIALCNAGFGNVVIQSMQSTRDGKVELRCGDANSGYVHIRAGKQKAWTNAMVGPDLWDDFMVFATVNAVEAPASTATQPGNKRCYTTPIKLYRIVNGKQQYVKTFNPTVIVSINNKIIITSIPSTSPSC